MSYQNIYDNETFFEGYRTLRNRTDNANVLFEQPALLSLLGNVEGMTMLDLGCGFGEHCSLYADMGAKRVVGIDISEKMLGVARHEHAAHNIEYLKLPMEEIGSLQERFDMVVSSLAIHYVQDFAVLAHAVHERLYPGGYFVFSQEHPLTSCFSGGERWTRDEAGRKIFANIAAYSVDGERKSRWFIDGVRKYHRTFSTIINTLVDAGFSICRLLEPIPDEKTLSEHPEQSDLLHKPDFLLIKAVRE